MSEFGFISSHKENKMTHREIELQNLWDKLDGHDWFYHFSDSSKVFDRGVRAETDLSIESHRIGTDAVKMFEEFKRANDGSNKHKKPMRPGGPKPAVKHDPLWF